MTEADWLAATDPQPMLKFLHDKVSSRKLWLFACGASRRLLPLMTDERSRAAVDVAEKWADHLVTEAERHDAQRAAQDVWDREDDDTAIQDRAAWVADILVRGMFAGDAWVFRGVRWASLIASEVAEEVGGQEQSAQASLVRCSFGNPFRPTAAAPAWLTSGVVALARRMYDERDFSAMPILADALQDAGCEQPDVLAHCRGDGPHVRGCWVVDLVLGKT